MRGNGVYVAIAAIWGITAGYQRLYGLHFVMAVYLLFLLRYKRDLLSACLLAAALFYLYMIWTETHNQTILSKNKTHFSLRLIEPPVIDGDQLKVKGRTKEKEKVQLLYKINRERDKKELFQLRMGMVCRFEGRLEAPEPARNFFAFDYRKYLRSQQIHWIVKPSSFSVAACKQTRLHPVEVLRSIREKGMDEINEHFPPAVIGIVQALIFGEREEMDEDLLEGYQKLGLVHLLAISGSHVTLLVSGCFYLCIRFITREAAALLLILLLPLYMILTGASPSVVRASVMAMMLLWSRYRKFNIPLCDILSLTCIVMVLIQPYDLFQPGFQLSFIVSFALILSMDWIEQYRSFMMRLFAATLVAQISSLPFLLYHFFEFSLLSIPLNMIFVPLYSFIILPLSIIALVAHYVVEPLSLPFIYLLEHVLDFANRFVQLFASDRSLAFVLGRPSMLLLLCYGMAIVWAFTQMEQKKYRAFGYVVIVIAFHAAFPYMNRYGEVVFLDVGQGDCIYIELPYRKGVYLIDTGGTVLLPKQSWQKRRSEWRVGAKLVVPFLKAKGIRQLDQLIITHGDADHMGAAPEVIRSIRVKELVIGNESRAYSPWQTALMAGMKDRKMKIKKVEKGDDWKVGEASFYVLNPPRTALPSNDNDRSVVLYAKLGGLSWLFTGDLEAEGEGRLIRDFPHLQVDVLKIGHHGSATSTSEPFLKMIKPQIAIISVGKNNRYHHPHHDVIARLKKHGVRILRTDEHGAIRYRYTKKAGTFTFMLP
ncbi:DNA internalization-related competence protein ComEC/Rec2 [Anoxybacteroides rupiense]|uniref:DNA internalization-related competence protein ComEC/Rec2 n=1 Tax=Anoxybacteroides rupiense TaxID=311460 RepID=UPI001605790B|nr:DNA internalization-related competence protein ComEC/Rec2 [Anoxybacillus rupiensis]MBB3906924.1 competence protein ComEC [Anoxybacillus rupiensis]